MEGALSGVMEVAMETRLIAKSDLRDTSPWLCLQSVGITDVHHHIQPAPRCLKILIEIFLESDHWE